MVSKGSRNWREKGEKGGCGENKQTDRMSNLKQCRGQCLESRVGLAGRDGKFGPKLVQIGPKWDKSASK